MSEPMSSANVNPVKKSNIVRARVTIRGTRPLLQHAFGPDSIPLEKGEKTGVAGNDPFEWKRTCLVTAEGQLYVLGTYIFGCIRAGSRHTKKGRGSIQSLVAATLQVEEPIVTLNRWMPKEGDPPMDRTAGAGGALVYIDVAGVRNPQTKGRNIRYRLAAAPGWECAFTLRWDRTLVSREQMKAVLNDSGVFGGIGDGIAIGNGRFEVIDYKELTDAEEASTPRSLEESSENRVAPRRKKVQALPSATEVDGVPH